MWPYVVQGGKNELINMQGCFDMHLCFAIQYRYADSIPVVLFLGFFTGTGKY